jgi:hypothetical protein
VVCYSLILLQIAFSNVAFTLHVAAHDVFCSYDYSSFSVCFNACWILQSVLLCALYTVARPALVWKCFPCISHKTVINAWVVSAVTISGGCLK